MKCPRCSSQISDAVDKCHTCGFFAGAPNVREVMRPEETKALGKRYSDVRALSKGKGCEQRLEDFEQAVDTSSRAVINVSLKTLFSFVMGDNEIYQSYARAVEGESRKAAATEFDKHRLAVEGQIFGSYAKEIRYATLSLDSVGLTTYGPFSLILRDVAVSERATVLEDNSFVFITKHGIMAGTKLPLGYRSDWKSRSKLAIAKIGPRIEAATTTAHFPRLLLFSDGVSRDKDEFMEVHLFGGFDIQAVEAVAGNSRSPKGPGRAMLKAVKERLNNLGKQWIEND